MLRYTYSVLISLSLFSTSLFAKENHIDQNFPNTLMFIVSHASSDFSILKGKILESMDPDVTYYASKGKIIDAKVSCIVHDTAWHFEGILFNETSKAKMEESYAYYQRQLKDCLVHTGYLLTTNPNPNKDVAAYPEIVYRYKTGGATVRLKVTHTNVTDKYTITIFVSK